MGEVGEQDWRWYLTQAWFHPDLPAYGGAPAGRAALEQGMA